MDYLLTIHIGPVQGFIVSARRTRDLWFGSWLLSELCKSAAQAILARHDLDSLIFPAPAASEELAPASKLNVANRIVALIRSDPEETTRDVERAVRDRLATLAGQTFDHIDAYYGASGHYDRLRALQQIQDLPEIFWVAQPVSDPANAYPQVRRSSEAMLATRKATREFNQPEWAYSTPKSSLDGMRESVIAEDLYAARRDFKKAKEEKADKLYRRFRARSAERLSGVDLLKRLGNPSPDASSFPSTSHMAALSFLARLQQEERQIEGPLATYISKLGKLKINAERIGSGTGHTILQDYDGSMLFESRLAESLTTDEDRHAAREALIGFLRTISENDVRPIPYYALLVGDGDSMGSMIDAQRTPEVHRQFSQRLSDFAAKAGQIIKQTYDGALVYAGGDDVLAFLPLHTALDCAWELAQSFAEQLHDFQDHEGRTPTFSAGLVIAHHLEPMSDVMRLARDTERMAKGVEGKNALAMTLSKRGGVDRTVVGRWDTMCPRLQRLVQLLRCDILPAGAAYDLQTLAQRMEGAKATMPQIGGLLFHEATRILQRKRGQHGETPLSDSVIVELLHPLEEEASTSVIEQLVNEMIVAQALAQAEELAQKTKPTPEKGAEHESLADPAA